MADYACERRETLRLLGKNPEQSWMTRSNISVAENGKRYVVAVASGMPSASYQVDGYIISAGQKCDKLILVANSVTGVAIFIELKGHDINHAIEQLESTLLHNIFLPLPGRSDRVRARIVTNGCGPASVSRAVFEKARIRFKQRYNCELRILKSNQPDTVV